jgi:hypothetical protein
MAALEPASKALQQLAIAVHEAPVVPVVVNVLVSVRVLVNVLVSIPVDVAVEVKVELVDVLVLVSVQTGATQPLLKTQADIAVRLDVQIASSWDVHAASQVVAVVSHGHFM